MPKYHYKFITALQEKLKSASRWLLFPTQTMFYATLIDKIRPRSREGRPPIHYIYLYQINFTSSVRLEIKKLCSFRLEVENTSSLRFEAKKVDLSIVEVVAHF